nr:hypothetical protein [Tanacetum cinerariifolium]
MHNMRKTNGEVHAIFIEYEKCLPKKTKTPQVMRIKSGKIQKANKKSLKTKGNGFREVRKLKQRSLYLYASNAVRAQVEAIRSYDLVFPNGLVICLDNCHYAPSITGGVVSIHRLVENGFVQCFTDFGILVSKNNVHYFNVIPSNGIYEIAIHNLVSNDNSIYNVSTKRAKHKLDFTYRWHCLLAHISKKRIEKLQQERLLKSTDDESFDQCVSCLSGKMTRKSFPHRLERATDLLGIIHTDVYGPLRHVSRQGASYFITFMDDYIRYGYVYLLKIKHEVFETFNVFKNEVENQQGKTIKDLRSDGKIQDEDTSPSEITSEIPMKVEGFEPLKEDVIPVRRSEKTHRAPNHLCLNVETKENSLGDLNEPTSYEAAMLDLDTNKWLDAMNTEMQFMIDNKDDYEETFSPVADIRAIRILISIVAFYDYEIWQMDVKNAFLNGYLDEDIYMASGSNVTFLNLYVDDIIIMENHILSLQSVKDYLRKCFAMKDLGDVAFILGIKIYRDRSKQLIRLGQNAYMDKILKIYKMDNSKRGHILMEESLDLNKTQGASTPKENPGEPHWTAVKSILKYLRTTKDMFLVYGGNPEAELRVDCYCNAGFETEAEYIAAMEAVWIRKFILGLGYNLSSPRIDISMISCPSCNGIVESSTHIFFECVIAKDICNLVRNLCDIAFPPFFTSYEH